MGFTSFSRKGVHMQIHPVPHSGFSRSPGARTLLMSDKLKKPLVLTIQFQDSEAKTAADSDEDKPYRLFNFVAIRPFLDHPDAAVHEEREADPC